MNKVLDKETLFSAQRLVEQIYVDPKIVDYIVALVFATRQPTIISLRPIAKLYTIWRFTTRNSGIVQSSTSTCIFKEKKFCHP